ncbi:MAG: hypothetical protein F6K65_41520 [Moorea sp. SIO3C2]|nr:hypothetical protein [Moorena sp. SIO3C2]
MSSYDWPQELGNWVGPPADAQGQTLSIRCGDSWQCEHRWPEIAGMVKFRNVTQGAPTIDYWWDNGNSQIAFARGNRGFLVINHEDNPLSQTLMTGLLPGRYCNILATPSENSASDCEQSITVDTLGKAHFEVAPKQAIAIHIEARL